MARRRTVLLARLLFSLALIVAAWPAGASRPSRAAAKAPAACRMACCAKKAMVACVSPGLERPAVACKCEVKAPPPAAAKAEPAFVPTLPVLLLPPPALTNLAVAAFFPLEPAFGGTDPSPPWRPGRRSGPPRAPPVARA